MKSSKTVLLLFIVLASCFLVANASPIEERIRRSFREEDQHWLFRRKGGGGGSKGGSSAGSSGSKGGSSRGSTSPSSNAGRLTSTGSGTPRGPTGYYSGGATVPYRSGLVSPLGLTPFFIAPFALWMPFYWGPYGAYYYHLNQTAPALANNTDHNKTDPIICVCANYDPCGCDDTSGNFTLPNGTMYAVINGTEYAVINGTLDNGTTAPESSGAVGMSLYLTKSGTWTLWGVFGLTAFLAIQAL